MSWTVQGSQEQTKNCLKQSKTVQDGPGQIMQRHASAASACKSWVVLRFPGQENPGQFWRSRKSLNTYGGTLKFLGNQGGLQCIQEYLGLTERRVQQSPGLTVSDPECGLKQSVRVLDSSECIILQSKRFQNSPRLNPNVPTSLQTPSVLDGRPTSRP